jgi:hypothetical protein
MGLIPQALERLDHEQPPENLKPRLAKHRGVGTRRVHQQLRFNAVDLRRVHQQLQQMPEQQIFNCPGRTRVVRHCKHIADDRLGFFVDAEDIADHLVRRHRRISRQHVVVQILHQKSRRSPIIPMQTCTPECTFRFQHRPQHPRLKVAQVKDFAGCARCHASPLNCGPILAECGSKLTRPCDERLYDSL